MHRTEHQARHVRQPRQPSTAGACSRLDWDVAPDGPVSPGGANYRRPHLVPHSGGAVTAAADRLDPCGPCDCVAAAVVAVCCADAGFVAVVGNRIHCIALIVGMCLVLAVAVVGLLILVVVLVVKMGR